MNPSFYLNPRQATSEEPSAWQNEFAEVIESAFTSGAYDLELLVLALNASRVRPREGGEWTMDRFKATVAELGA
jgi:hypothetical protein